MTKKLLALTFLTAAFTQAGFADPILNFNERTAETILVQSLEQDDFYNVTMSEILDGRSGNMSAIFYIPKEILTNGSHELEVIKPGKIIRSNFYCKSNPKYKFKLPSHDKIYVVFQDLALDDSNAKRFKFDGVVAANGKQGDFSISDLTETESGTKSFLFSFEIETKNTSYLYSSLNIDEDISCKKFLKISKVKFGKVVSKATTSGNSDAVIDPL